MRLNQFSWLSTPLAASVVASAALVFAAGCSDPSSGSSIDRGNKGGSSNAGGSDNFGGTGGMLIGSGGTGNGMGGTGGIIQGAPPCPSGDPNEDRDGDGFTPAQGDCNDCTDQINPAAYDYPNNNVDDDCDGTIDNEPAGCGDVSIPLDSNYPGDALNALDLCRAQNGSSWGVKSVAYVKADGSNGMNPLSRGILEYFGANLTPRKGKSMLALSSGTARSANMPGYQSPQGIGFDMGTQSSTPPGFPVAAPSCPGQISGDAQAYDPAALKLQLKVPSNANAVRFDFIFYTYEYPNYICSEYNDFFVAIVDPPPPGSVHGNVSFDNQGNPVSVNNGYLEVCTPGFHGGKQFDCPQGTSLLQGTGYGPGASTGWLQTIAPVTPGSDVTLTFAIWDAGDNILNSTVLIDNVTFDVTDASVPVTEPPPK